MVQNEETTTLPPLSANYPKFRAELQIYPPEEDSAQRGFII